MRRRNFLKAGFSVVAAGAALPVRSEPVPHQVSAGDGLVYSRRLPVIAQVDVLVAGGGPAGIAAAVTAAKAGAKTMIIEQSGTFGGAGTLCGVAELMNFDDGEHFLAGGFGRIIHDELYGECRFRRETHPVDTEKLKRLYDRLAVEAGVAIRFYTRFVDVIRENAAVKAAVVGDPSGVGVIAAKTFVDATGNGLLAVMAGADHDYGDEQGVPMAATLCSIWGGVDFSRRNGEGGRDGRWVAEAFKSGMLSQYDTVLPGIMRNFPEAGVGLGNVGHVFAVDDRDVDCLSRAMVKGRASLAEYERYYRRYIEGCEKATLVHTADYLGIRASRRIRCEKTLASGDFEGKTVFPDEIGRYSYPIDIHPKSADTKGMKGFSQAISRRHGKGESYGIPYGSLIPKKISNVLVAGRIIGADNAMQASVRVIPGCYITGQAAGMAAALARGGDVRGVAIGALRDRLAAVGAYLG